MVTTNVVVYDGLYGFMASDVSERVGDGGAVRVILSRNALNMWSQDSSSYWFLVSLCRPWQ